MDIGTIFLTIFFAPFLWVAGVIFLFVVLIGLVLSWAALTVFYDDYRTKRAERRKIGFSNDH